MPSNDQNKDTINKVLVVGKVVEFDAQPKTDRNGSPAIVIRGRIAVGPRVQVRFDRFIPKFRKDGSIRKDYAAFESASSQIKTIQAVGEEAATVVEMIGSLSTNDRVSKQGELVQSLSFGPNGIRLDVSGKNMKAEYTFEGFIADIKDTNNGPQVKVYGLDYKGDIVPLSFYVPDHLKDVFEEEYETEQTAIFYIDYTTLETKPAPTASRGIGIQRTSGAARCDYVLAGAEPPLNPSQRGALDPDDIRDAVARRRASLREIEEKGYLGGAKRAKSFARGIASQIPAAATIDDYEDF